MRLFNRRYATETTYHILTVGYGFSTGTFFVPEPRAYLQRCVLRRCSRAGFFKLIFENQVVMVFESRLSHVNFAVKLLLNLCNSCFYEGYGAVRHCLMVFFKVWKKRVKTPL